MKRPVTNALPASPAGVGEPWWELEARIRERVRAFVTTRTIFRPESPPPVLPFGAILNHVLQQIGGEANREQHHTILFHVHSRHKRARHG